MMEYLINEPVNTIQYDNWYFSGMNLFKSEKRIQDLTDIFHDKKSLSSMRPEQLVYQVQSHLSVKEGTAGGLFIGTTIICPGKVGQEYFMTRGHFHSFEDRSEYYWGIQGEGVLILKNRNGELYGEKMFPGSLHYINAHTAHRVANTGATKLVFAACWPSDSGHNYEEISKKGFNAILIEENGKPKLIEK